MRRDLAEPGAAFPLADGLSMRSFTGADAPALHVLLEKAYADGGGGVLPLRDWWPTMRDDPEFSEETCWLVQDASGQLVAAAQCWITGFIKDFVVHPDHRRRGIGSGLLSAVFFHFRLRGAGDVKLKVLIDNAPAIALYTKLGMRPI